MPAFRFKIALSAAVSAIALVITVQPAAAYTPEQQQASSRRDAAVRRVRAEC